MKTSLVGVVVTLAVAFVPACGGISSSETEQPAAGSGGGGTGGGSGGAGIGGTGGSAGVSGSGGGTTTLCGSATCNQLEQCFNNQYCVAKLIPINGGYSIDATEVTRDQYAAWLGTAPTTSSGQPLHCSWNTDYTPGQSCMGSPYVCQGAECGDHPVVCVDWCDAYAYCAGVGKRLCGGIGGGMSAFDQFANASVSQWYAACSSGGQFVYPHGDTYAGSTCNGSDAGNGTTVPVASMSGCQSSSSGYTGVYDLSGNVSEWEDSCNANSGNSDVCRVRGGSFLSNGFVGILRCAWWESHNDRGINGAGLGFRCCSSP
jgi:formylglycine-generating enzyme required for sulfatase activity